ncbi:hypothetical protein EW146_g6780 [Bondarzewia mesenterica]|uniref:Aprataxin C2HE/C2H2/C2HC zinc finger domain-containing protein n=1 Tax=Bondarzewia mesenterica TaxID=1095465 RepID=A0A4S4LPF1_9AGAM|nr:hypothetical protein EW146_g6780 [Bondarzewia mesenterica]
MPQRFNILRAYAKKQHPPNIPSAIYFSHTETTLTIFDAFPKSFFHFLILPRRTSSVSIFDLANLPTLLRKDKFKARETLLGLNSESLRLRAKIEEEMQVRFGFKWDVWIGFHAVPSMEHIHLHVISADLCGKAMRTKKHYNSFSPKSGFFIPLADVLSLFDAAPSYYDTMSEFKKSQYEPKLKEDFVCFHCDLPQRNFPILKAHLLSEFQQLRKQAQRQQERAVDSTGIQGPNKRKREGEDDTSSMSQGPQAKKCQLDEDRPRESQNSIMDLD